MHVLVMLEPLTVAVALTEWGNHDFCNDGMCAWIGLVWFVLFPSLKSRDAE